MLKMVKGKFALTALIAIILIVFVGCSNNSSSTASNKDEEKKEEQKVYELTLNSTYPNLQNAMVYSGPEFIKAVEERSNGRIKINAYYSGELVPTNELINGLASGTIDLGLGAPSVYSQSLPTGNLTQLPYWADSFEHALEVLHSDVGAIMEREFEEQGAKILHYNMTGELAFATTKPVEKYEDLSKFIFRSQGVIVDSFFKKIGISTASIAYTDLYDALQRGVIDGNLHILPALETGDIGEVYKYVVEPTILKATPSALYISTKAWNGLPEDLQKILQEVALEMEPKAVEFNNKQLARIPEMKEKYGIKTVSFSEEDQQKINSHAQAVWDEFAAINENTAKIVELLRKKQGITE